MHKTITMASQCRTQPPPSVTVCSVNCNKCVAATTSRMLYNTLVKKLDDRDQEQKTPVLTGLYHSDEYSKTTRLNPIPDPIPTPQKRKLVEAPSAIPTTSYINENFTSRSSTSFVDRKYYCYSKMQINNRNAAANAELLSEKTATGHGPCTNHKKKSLDSSLKKLDRRLDKALNSREATHAFNVLRIKMEKDYRTKQSSDNQMYFDTRDNYVSPEDIRAKYKQICNSKEYVEAKESLL